MKKFFTLSFILCSTLSFAQSKAYINEFHYENIGADTLEFIEVAVETGYTCPSGLQVILYNGSNGNTYGTANVPLLGNAVTGGTLHVVNYSGLQNGNDSPKEPDGIALVCNTDVLQFISYEGVILANNGPAQGMYSVDVGVTQSSSTPVNSSIYYSGSMWHVSLGTNTKGALNSSQTTLPVILRSFDGEISGKTATIHWAAELEEEVVSYAVQWSNNARNFTTKTFISSNLSGAYSVTDNQLADGENFYRLEIAHLNGTSTYSPILRLLNNNSNPNALLKILENPVQNNTLVFRLSGFEYLPQITIIDAIGKVHKINPSAQGGDQKIDVSQLPPGTYFLKAADATATKIVRFVK